MRAWITFLNDTKHHFGEFIGLAYKSYEVFVEPSPELLPKIHDCVDDNTYRSFLG